MIKKTLRYTVLIAFLGLLVYTFYYLYRKNQEPDVVYETTSATYSDIVRQTVATGSVLPRQEILIKPKVSGIVEKLFVKEGDVVKTGDMIARIKIIPDMISLSNAENRLSVADIGFENSKLEYERNKQLYDNEVISLAEFQSSELRYKNARQEVQAAKDNLQIVREGISSRSEGHGNTIIRSTKSGTVLDVPVEEGNSVIESNNFNEGTTIANIADLSDMIFVGKLDESEVGKIHTGMNISIRIGAIENEVFKGRLEFISPKGADVNGAIQFEIKAALSLRKELFVRAGYSANAEIVLDRRDSVLSVKESLVTFAGDSVYVEVEKKTQEFEKKLIKLGLSDGISAEVLEGLDTTMRIKVPKTFSDEEKVSD